LFSLGRPSHYRRSSLACVIRPGRSPSPFLRPLAPRALPRFVATTDALTPAERFFGPCGHEPRCVPGGSPCLSRTHVPPFGSQPLHRPSPGISVRSRFISARVCQPADPVAWWQQRACFPSRSWPGLRNSARRLASRCSRIGFTWCLSRCYGRVVHLRQLPTPCYHDAVAFGFRRVNVLPDGDFHPAVCTPPQAHERGRLGRRPRRLAEDFRARGSHSTVIHRHHEIWPAGHCPERARRVRSPDRDESLRLGASFALEGMFRLCQKMAHETHT
jgi:hypothetical protein